jgi:hypothetical protein
MSPGAPPSLRVSVPSLTWTTLRRTAAIGWLYLVIGGVISLLLTFILVTRTPAVFQTTFPLEVPLFAGLGSTGGLMTFSSDRTKGVFEYLIAYGVRPRTLFANALLATAAMASVVLGLALAAGLLGATIRGVPIPWSMQEEILLYTIPMCYATALFTATVGMIWSSVATPRAGMNSPIGIAPMIGVGPILLVLLVAEGAPSADYYYITVGAAAAILAAVVVLLALSAKLMRRERFLSPL